MGLQSGWLERSEERVPMCRCGRRYRHAMSDALFQGWMKVVDKWIDMRGIRLGTWVDVGG